MIKQLNSTKFNNLLSDNFILSNESYNIIIKAKELYDPTQNLYFCNHCTKNNISLPYESRQGIVKHILNHHPEINDTQSYKFLCQCCSYTCNDKSSIFQHVKTQKHKKKLLIHQDNLLYQSMNGNLDLLKSQYNML